MSDILLSLLPVVLFRAPSALVKNPESSNISKGANRGVEANCKGVYGQHSNTQEFLGFFNKNKTFLGLNFCYIIIL